MPRRNIVPGNSDWLNRHNLVDVYPRKDDPFMPPGMRPPSNAPIASSFEQIVSLPDVYQGWLTVPSARPVVYQRALTFQITVGTSPVPLTGSNGAAFSCDTIVLNVDSAAANSAFFGYGNGVTVNSGIEIVPGTPVAIQPENQREQWEIQRLLEAIAGMIAHSGGFPPIGQFTSPRVVFNSSEYFLVAAAAVNVRVLMFTVPEFQ